MSRWRAFLASMLITLFCLVPLYLIIIGSDLFGAQPADTPAQQVPVLTPLETDVLTLLLVTDSDTTPAAALVRLDAWQRRAEILVLPSNMVLLRDGAPVTVQRCCAAAGPLQLRAALKETLGVDCHRYLSLSGEELAAAFGEFSPVLDWDGLGPIKDITLLRRFAFNGGQGAVSSSTAALLLRRSEAGPVPLAQLRATLYGAFLQEGLPSLAEPVVGLLRSDARLFTDITAVDIYGIQRLLELLQASPPTVTAAIPDGRTAAAGYEISQTGLEQLRELLQ